MVIFFFFFNDTATTEIYTLSLHDALPILPPASRSACRSPAKATPQSWWWRIGVPALPRPSCRATSNRSEEHTSELQSQSNLVCRLLLEKKKKNDLLHSMHLLTLRSALQSM